MQAEPTREHQWLQRLVGEWTSEAETRMGPDEPPSVSAGTESVRSLGGVWVVCEGQAEMPGAGEVTMIMTLGYDPQRQRFVGTWVGSMMTQLWVYDGELDPAGGILTLSSEGPAFTGEGKANYQDVIEFKNDDHRVMTSRVQRGDGSWQQFMTVNFRRVK